MAQTYSEFKDYVSDFIWRQNDTDLAASMDKIIRMANAELNRKLNIQRREVSDAIAPETQNHTLFSDFYTMISLTNTQLDRQRSNGPMRNATKMAVERMRILTDSAYIMPYYYVQRAADSTTLFLVGPFSASRPGSFVINYRTTVPDYETEDSSWVEEDYLDLYVYAVLKHVAVFLREDERVQLYSGYLNDAIVSAVDDDLRNVQFGGSPMDMRPHHHVPRTTRR